MENNSNINIPKNTLYIKNLNENLKIDELKINLYHLFSEFGDIIEINCRKSLKMRGQAFIVFKDINAASNAKQTLNNFLFFGKTLDIKYAKTENDKILRLKGEMSAKEKIEKDLQRKKLREKEYEIIYDDNLNKELNKTIKNDDEEINDNNNKDGIPIKEENRNRILFVQIAGEFKNVKENMINIIFSKFNGFKNARLLENKGICFVEYDNDLNAGAAMFALNNFKITNDAILKITFAKD